MIDPLFVRADLAIDESLKLQRHSRALHAGRDLDREQLHLAVLESAMLRSECKAFRDDRA